MQYTTSFTCPECGEHTFQTEAAMQSEKDLAGAECTNCGRELTAKDIASQGQTFTEADVPAMIR